MAIQNINTGSGPNSGNGDTLRTAFTKINSNFNYIINTLTNAVNSETDPKFSTSTAASISATDVTNWNQAYQSYLTVTNITLTQGNQPNITSIGTLTNLVVDGTITAQGLNIDLTSISISTISTDDPIETTSNEAAINTSTGALRVVGGAGIGGDLWATKLHQTSDSVSIGFNSGFVNQSNDAISLGSFAGQYTQSQYAVSIGYLSGRYNQGQKSISIGYLTGKNTQTSESISIGVQTGENSQGLRSIAIGRLAGQNNQNSQSIAIGDTSAQNNQNAHSIAIGEQSAKNNQGQKSISIGYLTGFNNQSTGSVAIGPNSAQSNQGIASISIGDQAGSLYQKNSSIAIGQLTGHFYQGADSVSIGPAAGYMYQGDTSIAIGRSAGRNYQGTDSIAIGNFAGFNTQISNSIILNASGSILDATTSGFYVSPIRADSSISATNIAVYYNPITKELTTASTAAGTTFNGGTINNPLVITDITPNTTSDTGALVVAGGVGIGENLHVHGYGHFGLEPTIAYTNPIGVFTADADDFMQIAIQNLSTGTSASSDVVLTADDGSDDMFYVNLGINNSNYSDLAWTISGPHDGYLYVSNGNLTLGTTEPATYVKVHIGGTLEGNVVATFREPGTDSTSSFTGALTVDGGIGITGQMHLQETLHVGGNHLMLPDAVFIGSRDINSYVQLAVQNQNAGEFASSDFIATADNGDDTSYYIDLGINSSGYNNLDWTVSGPNDGYLYINSGNLTLGTDTTGTNVKIHIGGTLAENVVATFTETALTLSQHLLPAQDLNYDLGSTSSQWRSLYVGTSTIYLGGTALSVSGGSLTVDGSPVAGGGSATTSTLVNGTATVQLIIGGGNNPYTLFPEYEGGQLYIQGGELAANGSSTVAISAGAEGGNILLTTYGASPKQWAFDTDGLLTLPSGNTRIGSFYGSDAILCSTGTAFGIVSQGAGSSLLQWLDDINAPTVVAGIAANSLYSSTGSVQIFTGVVGSPPQHTWTFSDDGNLTFPNGTTQTTAFNFIDEIPVSSTSTGIKGQIAVSTSSMYICVGTNSWLRFDGVTF